MCCVLLWLPPSSHQQRLQKITLERTPAGLQWNKDSKIVNRSINPNTLECVIRNNNAIISNQIWCIWWHFLVAALPCGLVILCTQYGHQGTYNIMTTTTQNPTPWWLFCSSGGWFSGLNSPATLIGESTGNHRNDKEINTLNQHDETIMNNGHKCYFTSTALHL